MDLESAEEIIEEPVVEEADQDEPIVEADGDDQSEAETETDDEAETVITFGDDEPPKENDEVPAPEWVKDLRKQNRAQAAKIKELEKATAKADETPSQLSAKPTLEQADYNEAKYAESLESWYAEKASHNKAKAAKEAEAAEQEKAWQSRLGEYGKAKSKFKPDTIEDAEAVARDMLSETQQGVLIEALGKGAAALLVGLAANEARFKALASIKNPIRFVAEAARLESSMKTSTRRPKTVPETRVTGSGSTQAGNKTLEKLEAEADKTGDRSKVIAFKREQRLAKK